MRAALERSADHERLVTSLQQELNTLSLCRDDEKQASDDQLRQLQLSLMARNEECEGFINELRSVSFYSSQSYIGCRLTE